MIKPEVLDALLGAGATAEMIVAAVKADAAREDERREHRRATDAERQRRHRARNAPSRVTTCDNADGRDISPAPNKSPPDPQKLTPTPVPMRDAHARGLAAELSLAVLIAGCREALTGQPAAKSRWPRHMPPPPGVSDDQWAGFIEHRRAKRETLTPRAYDLLVGKLAKHADDEWPPGRIVDQIVERRWTSFEPHWLPRISETRNGNRPNHDRSSGWAARPGMAGVEPASIDDEQLGGAAGR